MIEIWRSKYGQIWRWKWSDCRMGQSLWFSSVNIHECSYLDAHRRGLAVRSIALRLTIIPRFEDHPMTTTLCVFPKRMPIDVVKPVMNHLQYYPKWVIKISFFYVALGLSPHKSQTINYWLSIIITILWLKAQKIPNFSSWIPMFDGCKML